MVSNLFRACQKRYNSKAESDESLKCQDLKLGSFSDYHTPATNIKIKKFLMSMIQQGGKSFETRANSESALISFVSNKHRVPLQVSFHPTRSYIGLKESDFRRIRKYKIVSSKAPSMCPITIMSQDKQTQKPIQYIPEPQQQQQTTSLYVQNQNCFSEIQDGFTFQQDKLLTQNQHNSSQDRHQYSSQSQQLIINGNHKIHYRNQSELLQYPIIEFNIALKAQIIKSARIMNQKAQQKQAILKQLAYACIKQVDRRYLKCIKIQNQYIIRGKKMQRECTLYWKKQAKDLQDIIKKKVRVEAQLKKRQQEQQQTKMQARRLQYIMYQSSLYAHFMATKLGVSQGDKKELSPLPISQSIEIDEEAAQLNLNQIINNNKDNLSKFQTVRKQKLDLSYVDPTTEQIIGTPITFHGTLKEYQIKGLRWLNNLFEQGINGILADQMGLGKTIQAIALLTHISCSKNIWGPFLVVAPNSTLYNWQQQFKKFSPTLRILPYWGNIKQRKTIRKFFSPKKFTQRQDSPFHVVITSYQLTVSDQKAFKRLKWQFMILDQAQAIKNVQSQRWNILKQFQTRNKLLLTGTPIQNSMAQLWALLNFVMPDLFDSHQLFNQWFSKDIQAHSQDQKELDQIKIQRLHAILKPFMLRRIKKDVQHQIGKKYQHQILCQMTKRQKQLYESIKQKLNVKDLFKMLDSKAKVQNLMNLVMQLRKVCNHPQLFQRRPARSSYMFQQLYYYTGYTPTRLGDIKCLNYNSKNPIIFAYPRIMYDWIRYQYKPQLPKVSFPIIQITDLSLADLNMDPLLGAIYAQINSLKYSNKMRVNRIYQPPKGKLIQCIDPMPTCKYVFNVYIPQVKSPPIQWIVSSISFTDEQELINHNKLQSWVLQGKYDQLFGSKWKGILNNAQSMAKIEIVDFGNLIADSSKLRQLDLILKQKKQNGDKVLIFCQMTKMIDILEDFMNLKKYTFFRLDGGSSIADRRDMVNDFQKPDSKIFVFLLSTRAGGLGVTLTAANTVVFYDNDWNPTMDAQATDRAHRIGQSQDVNVYQLVTKGTIEERIVKRAQQKKTVQTTVYEGASFNFFKRDMIMDLVADQLGQNQAEKLVKQLGSMPFQQFTSSTQGPKKRQSKTQYKPIKEQQIFDQQFMNID